MNKWRLLNLLLLLIVVCGALFVYYPLCHQETTGVVNNNSVVVVQAVNQSELIDYYQQLTNEPYAEHPNVNLEPSTILTDGQGSDCEDRSYSLAWKAKQLGYTNIRIVSLYWDYHDYGHMAVLLNGRIWDATGTNKNGEYKYHDYDFQEYIDAFGFKSYVINPYVHDMWTYT